MTILLEERVPRTLDVLVREWAKDDHRGTIIEAWLFEDEAARRRGDQVFAASGIHARLRSAYKPLVHAFLEELDTTGVTRAIIRYPVHEKADRQRFLSEAYPLAALSEGIETRFEVGDADLTYQITLEYADGGVAEHEVFAPNRLRTNHLASRRGARMEKPIDPVHDGRSQHRRRSNRALEAAWNRQSNNFGSSRNAWQRPSARRSAPPER